ncbi:MAG: DUF4349 domain-containing protein, partial [Clostridia bacterium]
MAGVLVLALAGLGLMHLVGGQTNTTASSAQLGVAGHAAAAPAPASSLKTAALPAQLGTPAGRQVIEQGSVTLSVASVDDAVARLDGRAQALGGFVASSSVSGSGPNQVGNLTLRVPEKSFGEFLDSMAGLGRVTSESQSGNDVTSQVNDLNVQIGAQKAEIAAYEALFQKATSMSDLIEIQQALTQAEANLLNLEQQAAGLHQEVA